LSVYYGPTEPENEEPAGKPDSEDDSDDDSDDDRDDESCVSEGGMGDMIYGMDLNDDFDDLEMDIAPKDKSSDAAALLQPGDKASKQRIRVGPPQNTDSKSSKKIPPQVHLMKVEKILHRLTRSVALEMMHPPPDADQVSDLKESTSKKDKSTTDAQDAQLASLKRKKVQLDEFDRMLGLQSESRNPITRITATFLGPLMRMFRVSIYLFRIAFNISTWRDPYMSFWVCLGLVIWCVILIWFPWRAFFLLVTVATVGPQNMFLRYYLEKKAEKKRKKELEEAEEKRLAEQAAAGDDYGYGVAEPQLAAEANAVEEKAPLAKPETSHPTGNSFFSRVFAKRVAADKVEDDDDDVKVDRPPFRTDPYEKVSSSKKSQARSIVIPYTRFKPDRFFDWPPDPTVSRATPLRQVVEREGGATGNDYGEPGQLPPMWTTHDNASVDESYDVSTDDNYGADLLGDDSQQQDDRSPVRGGHANMGTAPSSRTMELYGYGNDDNADSTNTPGLRRRHASKSGGAEAPHEPPLVHSQAYEEFEEEVEDYEYQDYYE
jgi:hypothetical protein